VVPNESKGEGEEKRRSVSLFVFSLFLSFSLSLAFFWKEALAEAIGAHNLVYHRLPFTSQALEVVTGARPYIPCTHARTRRKRAKTLEGRIPRVCLAFPQFCARFLATPRPRAGVCRRTDGSRRKLQRFAIDGGEGEEGRGEAEEDHSLFLEWYTHIITMPAWPGSTCPRRQRVHTKSRTRPTLQRQRVYRRGPTVGTKCGGASQSARLMAILFYARRLLCCHARQKSFARERDNLLYPPGLSGASACVNVGSTTSTMHSISLLSREKTVIFFIQKRIIYLVVIFFLYLHFGQFDRLLF